MDYRDSIYPLDNYSENNHPDSIYQNAIGAAAGPKKPAAKKATVELTILAYFAWDPPINGSTEIQYLRSNKWHPSTLDYEAITGTSAGKAVSDFNAFLGMITEQPLKSINRLNFFTHSDSKTVGIAGILDVSGVLFTKYLDSKIISTHMTTRFKYTYKKNEFYLDDVKDRFTDDAIFVIYGCDVASDPTTLLTELKDLFNVTTIGFREKIAFCPPPQDLKSKTFNRKGERIGVYKADFKCGIDSISDWRLLINDTNAVKVVK